ncbi:hypothetical protein BVZ28_15605, partial [Alcaligenes faecalis]
QSACIELGIGLNTYRRWATGDEDRRRPLSHLYPAGAEGRVRDGPARSRRASADGVDQSGGPAARSSDRPCAQRAVSGSRKRP